MAKKYKDVRKHITSIQLYSLEGSIDTLVKLINKVTSQGYDDINVEFESNYYGYGDHSHTLIFTGTRKETDEERNVRLKKARNERKKLKELEKIKQEEEYKEYLRMKEKFENANK